MDITQFLQSQGVSRRTIISLLQDGRIQKNGQEVTYRKEPVSTGDVISVHETTYTVSGDTSSYDIILFHKPIDYVVSKDDTHNNTIFQLLPPEWAKSHHYIGRLDKDSHGLLILTNATKLVSFFSHPRYNHDKVYHVQIDRPMSPRDIARGEGGVMYFDQDEQQDILLSRKSCKHIKDTTYEIIISEGKKRHIRRLFAVLEYNVYDLCRVRFASWELGDIPVGKWKQIIISSSDVESLLASQNSYTQTQT